MIIGSPFMINGSPSKINGSPFMINGSLSMINGSPFMINGSLSMINGSPSMINGSPRCEGFIFPQNITADFYSVLFPAIPLNRLLRKITLVEKLVVKMITLLLK